MEMMKEAIDTFIIAEEWNKARKVAKELEPAYESYVESKYKDRLLKKGDVEQLADVGEDLIIKFHCNISFNFSFNFFRHNWGSGFVGGTGTMGQVY